MRKSISRFSIRINQKGPYTIGDEVSGAINIIPDKDIRVLKLGYKLEFEIRGFYTPESYPISSSILIEDVELKVNKEYTYPFKFRNNKQRTYKGLRIEFLVKIDAFVTFEPIEKSTTFLSKVNLFKSDLRWEQVRYLDFTPRAVPTIYKIVTKKMRLKLSLLSKSYVPILFILFFLTFFGENFELFIAYKSWIIGIIIILAVAFFSYILLSKLTIGNIDVEFDNIDNDTFKINVKNSYKWKYINSVLIRYKISEEVKDQRGSSTHTETSIKYLSKPQQFKNPTGLIQGVYKFPPNELHTIRYKDIRIYWSLEIKIKSIFGIDFRFNEEFITKN